VFVSGGILYPFRITMDLWMEIVYYWPGWHTKDNCKDFLPITFIRGHVGKSSNLTILVGFSRLPHGFSLLGSNVHAMDSPPTHEPEMLGALGWAIHSRLITWSSTVVGNIVGASCVN
jgi:hypothetical protein